jgi:hypothetical protein
LLENGGENARADKVEESAEKRGKKKKMVLAVKLHRLRGKSSWFFFRRQSPAKTNELAIKLALDCDAMLVELLRSGRRSEDVIQYRSELACVK